MKKFLTVITSFLLITVACSEGSSPDTPDNPSGGGSVSEQNLNRAMQITDKAISAYFTGDGMAMTKYYNPYTNARSSSTADVWPYTSSIEAVNAILHGLKAQKDHGNTTLYNQHFNRYVEMLGKLYDNMDYYLGTFTLISYTQTKEWTVYGVHRGGAKGSAQVEGRENVYDDQMWIVRELLEAYKLTNDKKYLDKAEYLTEYVLDGWDCTRDANGDENGGIPWGPAYVSKHSCSNGPIVSPLVWLHELYKGKSDMIEHRYIDAVDKKTRKTQMEKKSDYYLAFAQKVYDWQKKYLLGSNGLYYDSMNSCEKGDPQYETVDNVTYRTTVKGCRAVGDFISYNCGTMLSGAADLYRVTGNNVYLEDAKSLSDKSFTHFAKLGNTKAGYYTYDISGFNNWFNGVLMRAYVDIYPSYKNVNSYINSFQQNLDYGHTNYLYNDFLPSNLLIGWNMDRGKNNTDGMFEFAFAAEYAVLARYELEKEN